MIEKNETNEYLWEEWLGFQGPDRRAVLEPYAPWNAYKVEGFDGLYSVTGATDGGDVVLTNLTGADRITAHPNTISIHTVDAAGGRA